MRVSGDRKFEQVVVGLVRQVRAPRIIDLHQAATVQKAIEYIATLAFAEDAAGEQMGAAKHVLIFSQ
jgi:hypothetical protein